MSDDSNVFDRAADKLREHGWIKGQYHSPRGYCLWGAVQSEWTQTMVAVYDDDWSAYSPLAVLDSIVIRETPYLSAITYNDAPETTAEDVLLILKRAAECWDGLGQDG